MGRRWYARPTTVRSECTTRELSTYTRPVFDGGVFSQELPQGRAGARVQLRADAIEAETEDGKRFSVDPGECRLQLGGSSGKMWFCHNPDRSLTIYSEAPGIAAALAAIPGLRAQVDALLEADRRAARRTWRWVAVGVLGALLLGLAGYHGLQGAGRAVLHALPASADRKIGDLALDSMDLGGERSKDKELAAALQQIVTRLAKHSGDRGFRFRVHVIDASTVNAFALPGGNIVVYTGLVRAAEDPSEVAGVLAHEMSHVTLRHGMERIAQAAGVAVVFNLLLGDVGGLAALAAEMLKAGTLTSYGRDQERASDLEGVRVLHAAGIDPDGLARFFETLEKEQAELPAGVSWLSSHPELSERSRAVRARAAELGRLREQPLSIDWADIRRRAGFTP
jgi:beta-barrel assembly-enhancing protease